MPWYIFPNVDVFIQPMNIGLMNRVTVSNRIKLEQIKCWRSTPGHLWRHGRPPQWRVNNKLHINKFKQNLTVA